MSKTSKPIIVDIVTGSTQGIGKAVAEYIAMERSKKANSTSSSLSSSYWLFLVGRNAQRGNQVRDSILQQQDNLRVAFEACDLSDWHAVQELQKRIATTVARDDYQVGILVNNAAECPRRQQFVERPQKSTTGEVASVTKLDRQFASNVLGYHFMLRAFQDHFQLATTTSSSSDDDNNNEIHSTHIINVASTWAGDLDLNDINFQRRSYDNDLAYRQSKQCNRMLNKVWSRHLHNKALVNACHPGDPCTTLSKDLGYNLYASAPTLRDIQHSPFPYLCGLLLHGPISTTGGWFVGSGTKPSRCGFERKSNEAEELFELCDSFCV